VPSLFKELQGLKDKVFSLEEVELGARQIGTTRHGMDPIDCMQAHTKRNPPCEIFDPELFERKLREFEQGALQGCGDLFIYNTDIELQRFRIH
jgi:adenylosuccinate synthase